MYKTVKLSRAIQYVVLILILFIMITIYPIRMWKETIPSVSNQILAGASDYVDEDYMLQRFIAQYNHLGTVNLYITEFENGWDRDQKVENFIFRMLDSNMEILFDTEVDTRFAKLPGFCTVYVNEDMEVGKDYYFFLQGNKGSRIRFGLEETESAGTPYVSRLVFNYDQLEGYNIIGEYNYSVPLRKHKVFMLDAILLVFAAAVVGAVELYFRKTKKDRLVTVEGAFRFTANTLIGVGTLAALWTITIRKFFSGQLLDNLFYTLGALLCSLFLLYWVNQKRDKDAYKPLIQRVKEQGQDWLQILFFAAAIWACCSYMNGLYDIHHRLAERQFMVYFILAALCMSRKKELLNPLLPVYAVVAGAVLIWYHLYFVDYIAMDEWDIKILRWGMAAVVLAGFFILNLVLQVVNRIRKKQWDMRISPWFGVLLGIFFLLLILYRNTRQWPVVLVIAYTLFYLRYALWDKKAHLLQNISNGMLLHFICCMIFCFARRPFLSWIYPRYPFIFHTVTVTAVYMTFVLCAAVIKLVEKYRSLELTEKGKKQNLKTIFTLLWKELFFLGAASTYMLFTCSRTGFLAVAALMITVAVMTVLSMGKGGLKAFGRLVVAMVAAVAVCFPVIFTAQRILPAVYNDVFQYEIETYPDPITRGNEWDSMYYITVERFAEVFNNKIFGIPEGGSTSYERSEEYQRYRAKRFNHEGDVVWEGSVADMYEEENPSADTAAEAEGKGSNQTTAAETTGSQNNGSGVDASQLDIISTRTEDEQAAAAMADAAARAELSTVEEETEVEEEEETNVYETAEDYANGRMDIFRSYLEQLDMKGHKEMGAVLPDGTTAVHAHNIYLQVAYDHGILVGVLFILVGTAGFIQACIFYQRRKETIPCAAFPAAVVVAFATAGLVEWIFHLCNPAGCLLLLVMAPLLFDMGKKEKKSNGKQEKNV